MRFVTPVLFFAAAIYVHTSNAKNDGTYMLFPFIDAIVPSTKGDYAAMGEASVTLLMVVGGVMTVLAIYRTIRDSRASD